MVDFHFIRPLWLLTILLLIAALYLLKRLRVSQSGWDKILPKHLATLLITTNTANANNSVKKQAKPLSLFPVALIGLLTIIALAGPTWQKLPQPVFKVNQGSVLIMDMSYSMYATDITPNRLTRARYKAIDLLNDLTEGEVGLIAYAGDAFTISPLTEDINNIKLLLPSLSPELMPELGSNPLAALVMADEMLKNSGHLKGDMYWFTDGVDRIDISDIEQWSEAHPYNLHILGVGTRNGAPIKLPNGELLKDNSGAIVIPHLSVGYLSGLAKRGRGNYQTISNDSRDIETLLADSNLKKQPLNADNKAQHSGEQTGNQLGDSWQEAGPYLLLLILPLLLGYFRRGNIVMLLPLALLLTQPQQAQAGIWQDLWKTNDQQAQQKFDQKAYQQAAKQFKDPLWQGSAYYKAGDYEKALAAFQQDKSAQSLYNQGNALAKLKKLDQAIDAYKKALAKDPTLTDAEKNKVLLEKLKKQQDQQKKNQKQNKDKNQKKDKQKNQDQQGKNQQNDQQQKSDDSKQQDQQKKGQQQKSDTDKNKSDQNKKNQEKDGQNQQQNKQSEQEKKAQEEAAKKKQAEQAAKKAAEKNLTPEQKAAQAKAKLAKEQHDKEMQQKYQQLMNKVTDDPYLLLRNKMQLEYRKRRGDTQSRGSDKKW